MRSLPFVWVSKITMLLSQQIRIQLCLFLLVPDVWIDVGENQHTLQLAVPPMDGVDKSQEIWLSTCRKIIQRSVTKSLRTVFRVYSYDLCNETDDNRNEEDKLNEDNKLIEVGIKW